MTNQSDTHSQFRERERLLLRRMALCTLIVVTLGPLSLLGGILELALVPALIAAAISARTAFQLRALHATGQ